MEELNEEAMQDLMRLEMLSKMDKIDLIFNHKIFDDRWEVLSDLHEELEELMMEGGYENSKSYEGLFIAQGLIEDKMAEISTSLEEIEIFLDPIKIRRTEAED